jgi:methylglutaconyl-CoA hydratase
MGKTHGGDQTVKDGPHAEMKESAAPSERLVIVEECGPDIAIITMNRPRKKNAVNIDLLEELCNALDEIRLTKRVLILKGSEPDFCSGLELSEIVDGAKAPQALELMVLAIQKIMSAPHITISAVQGAALAGGAALMLACDFAIVAEDAQIGFPEVRRGLVPTMPLTFLRRRVGDLKARELILTGEPISGIDAVQIGLANNAYRSEQVVDEAKKLADVMLRNARGALRQSKALLDDLWHLPVSSHLERCSGIHRRVRTSAEANEGFSAFMEKRKPRWDHHVDEEF